MGVQLGPTKKGENKDRELSLSVSGEGVVT